MAKNYQIGSQAVHNTFAPTSFVLALSLMASSVHSEDCGGFFARLATGGVSWLQ
jgi:hypothetical protein